MDRSMDGYIDLTDQELDKLDRIEERMDEWTDAHVTCLCV